MAAATLLLRLEGPLQAWGDPSKFVIRRTMEAPTKSGVLGMICSAEGLTREEARARLPALNELRMGVRIDRPGARWWDYHTVGAGIGLLTAEGEIKKTASTGEIETLVTRREYLADASFLVALRGEAELVREVHAALDAPRRPLFLGRKCCQPALPILERAWERNGATVGPLLDDESILEEALARPPWRARVEHGPDKAPSGPLDCLVEWN
ncbi:MAG: type I-E CRISPR-associated protein Cas5/CasD, partial [Candidatus Methylomirabilis sp.]|nr:type I-E CRISPR-associated protein Cas5/CasD [Deltaproteobacteria bacterium]